MTASAGMVAFTARDQICLIPLNITAAPIIDAALFITNY
jgi:hypothetical protein